MSKNIKPEELQDEITKYLENWTEDIEDEVKKTAKSLSKEAVKEIKKISPRRKNKRKNPYHQGWTTKTTSRNKKYIITIYNKTNYQLTHLLEYGHATRNCGRTKAQPHIKPVEEKYNQLYEEQIKKALKGGARQ